MPSPSRRASTLLAMAALAAAVTLTSCASELICASGEVVVGNRCVSLQSDSLNCGAVGRACGAGESCSAGLCCQGSQCPPTVYAACFNTNSIQGLTPAAAPVGAPYALDAQGPIAFAWRGTELWVASSMSNTLDPLAVSPTGLEPSPVASRITIPVGTGTYSDLEAMAESGGLLYVANAAVGSLVILDPSSANRFVREIPFGASSYPQGIALGNGKAFVTLRGTNEIAVVDLANQSITRRIAVAALGSPGGSAMPGRIVVAGSRAYAVLWNLDPFTDPWVWAPAGNGRLAVIDLATDSLAPVGNPVDLGPSCLNPGGLAVEGTTLWVTCGYQKYDPAVPQPFQGASFVPVDVSGSTPVVGAPLPVGSYGPGPIAFCNGTGYAGDRYSGNVLRLDPTGRTVLGATAACPPSAYGFAMVGELTCGK